MYRFPWSSFLSIEIECTYEAAEWAKSEKRAIYGSRMQLKARLKLTYFFVLRLMKKG